MLTEKNCRINDIESKYYADGEDAYGMRKILDEEVTKEDAIEDVTKELEDVNLNAPLTPETIGLKT